MNSSSGDEYFSRKRPSDNEYDGSRKRRNLKDSGDFFVKLLLPNNWVGAIIGKGGETIAKIQKDMDIGVRLSKAKEFFPGTQERVCLMVGLKSSCLNLLRYIVEQMSDGPEIKHRPDPFDFKNGERNREVKLIINNSTAGMVIGKQGSTIKEIRDQSGAQLEMSPKGKGESIVGTNERVLTLIGDPEELIKACDLVFSKIADDPYGCSNSTITYQGNELNMSSNAGPSPFEFGIPMRPSISPFERYPGSINSSPFDQDYGYGVPPIGARSNVGISPLASSAVKGSSNMDVLQFLSNLQKTLQSSGFAEAAISEIMQAMQVLAKYNVLGMGLGIGLAAINMDAGGTSNNSGFGNGVGYVGRSQMREELFEVEVPDHMIGIILGKQGRSLLELQQFTGARVNVSPKGSETRVITITGNEEEVRLARQLIDRRLNEDRQRSRPYR